MGTTKKIAGIYAITCITNNKKYIGHSVSIKKRWEIHRDLLRRNKHKNTHLQSAWNKEGEKMFIFSILEELPFGLTKEQLEEVETKWVLKFNTHQNLFGYNAVMPGHIPLRKEGENITNTNRSSDNRPQVEYVCINIIDKSIHEILGTTKATELTGIKQNKFYDLTIYWKGIGKRKSLNNWIVIRQEDYNPDFDYINYKKTKPKSTKTWRDYELTRTPRKKFTPYEERSIKRISVIAVNISTGQEKKYPTIKSTQEDGFTASCVKKLINNEYGKYCHRGFYFRKYLDN